MTTGRLHLAGTTVGTGSGLDGRGHEDSLHLACARGLCGVAAPLWPGAVAEGGDGRVGLRVLGCDGACLACCGCVCCAPCLRDDVLCLALRRQTLHQRVEAAERAPPRREPIKQNALFQRDEAEEVCVK